MVLRGGAVTDLQSGDRVTGTQEVVIVTSNNVHTEADIRPQFPQSGQLGFLAQNIVQPL